MVEKSDAIIGASKQDSARRRINRRRFFCLLIFAFVFPLATGGVVIDDTAGIAAKNVSIAKGSTATVWPRVRQTEITVPFFLYYIRGRVPNEIILDVVDESNTQAKITVERIRITGNDGVDSIYVGPWEQAFAPVNYPGLSGLTNHTSFNLPVEVNSFKSLNLQILLRSWSETGDINGAEISARCEAYRRFSVWFRWTLVTKGTYVN